MNNLTDQFIWWQGVVEDRDDPLLIGRCRVRILGYHTDNKKEIPTESLPWAYPAMPINTKPNSTPIGPNEGTWVMGFFRDGNYCQEPVMTHVIDSGFTTANDSSKGFNDPETNTGNPVGKVPLDVGEINTNRLGRGDVKDTWINQNQQRTEYGTAYKKAGIGDRTWTEPDTRSDGNYEFSAKFPYNYVEESESGHVFEVDDTPGKERLSKRHRSGSFEEMHSDGSVMTKVVKDNYEVILGEDNIYVSGSVNITSDSHVNIKSGKTIRIQSDNQIRFKSGSSIIFDAVGAIQLKGAFVSTAEGVPFMHGGGSPFVAPFGVPLLMDNQRGPIIPTLTQTASALDRVEGVSDIAEQALNKITDNSNSAASLALGELTPLTTEIFNTTIPFVFPSLPRIFNPLAMSYAHMARAMYEQIANFGIMSLDMTSVMKIVTDITGVVIDVENPRIPFPPLKMLPVIGDYANLDLDILMRIGDDPESLKNTVMMAMLAQSTATTRSLFLKYGGTLALMNKMLDTDWRAIGDLIKGSTDVEAEDIYKEVEVIAESQGLVISQLSGEFERGEYLVIDNVKPQTIIGTVVRHSNRDIIFKEKSGVFTHMGLHEAGGEGRIRLEDLVGYNIRGMTSQTMARVEAVSRENGFVVEKYRDIVEQSTPYSFDIEGIFVDFSEISEIKDKDDLIAMLIRIFGADWKEYFEVYLSDEDVTDIVSRVGSTSAGGISTLEKLGEEVLILTGNIAPERQTDNNIETLVFEAHGGDHTMIVEWLPLGSFLRIFEADPLDKDWDSLILSTPTRSKEFTVNELSSEIMEAYEAQEQVENPNNGRMEWVTVIKYRGTGVYQSHVKDLVFEHNYIKSNSFRRRLVSDSDLHAHDKYYAVSIGSPTDISKNSAGRNVTFEVEDTTPADIEAILAGEDITDTLSSIPIVETVWYVVAMGRHGKIGEELIKLAEIWNDTRRD